MSLLADALAHFVAAYHAREDLVAEQAGWSPTIRLESCDSGEALTVQMCKGRIIAIGGDGGPADLVITADRQTLCDVLELRRGPNEPYLFGELTVRGAEADFVRIDYIAEQLCPQ